MKTRKLALMLAVVMLLSLTVFVVPASAAGKTIYFYAGTSANPATYKDADGISYSYKDGVWILAMNPDSGWADVNGNNWAPQKMTDMGDGWWSYDLAVDPAADPGVFVQFRNDGDSVTAANKIFTCYISHAGQQTEKGVTFNSSNLWVIPKVQSENWNESDNVREVFGTSYATKAAAEAALGGGATTEGGTTTSNPKTGDNTFLFIALAAMLLSGGALALNAKKLVRK